MTILLTDKIKKIIQRISANRNSCYTLLKKTEYEI